MLNFATALCTKDLVMDGKHELYKGCILSESLMTDKDLYYCIHLSDVKYLSKQSYLVISICCYQLL